MQWRERIRKYINLDGVAAPRAQRITADSIEALFSTDSAPATLESSMILLCQIKYRVRVQRFHLGILAVAQHAESIREEYKTIIDRDWRGNTIGRATNHDWRERMDRSNVCRCHYDSNATELRAVTFPKSKNRIRAKIHHMNLFVIIK